MTDNAVATTDLEPLATQALARPPDVEGRSKKLWHLADGLCLVELVPSLRSYTYGRDEMVDGTAELRLDFYELAADWMAQRGVRTAFVRRWDSLRYVSRFLPSPPFEVIVKNVANGSTTRKYPGLFPEGHRFSAPVVKFDYRTDPEDEPIGEGYLEELGVPVEDYKRIALACNEGLRERLDPLDLWDFCVVLGEDGGETSIISEISPDCMRLKEPDGSAFDKDIFRAGGSPEEIISRWRALLERVRR